MIREETTMHPYELRAQPAKALLQRLYSDLSSLATEEVELVKIEIRERATIVSQASRGFAFAMACGLVTVACFAACAIAVLTTLLPFWSAALIVAVLSFAIGVAAAGGARERLAAATEPLRSTLGALVGPPRTKVAEDDLRARIEGTRRHLEETLSALEQNNDLVTPMRETALGMGSIGAALSSIARSDKESN